MNEAYLATARKRVSLARHARLVDYHIHEGNQASTWLAVEVAGGTGAVHARDQELVVWTGRRTPPQPDPCSSPPASAASPPAQQQRFDPLRQSAAPAHVAQRAAGAARRQHQRRRRRRLRGAWRQPRPMRCAIWCATDSCARDAGRRAAESADRPRRRPRSAQAAAAAAASSGTTPPRRSTIRSTNTWLVRVHWRDEDALRFDYSFTTFCRGPPPDGRRRLAVLRQPGAGARGPADGGAFPRARHGCCRRTTARSSIATSRARSLRRRAAIGCCARCPRRPARLSADAARTAKCRRNPRCCRREPPGAGTDPGTRSRASCTATTRPRRATTSWSRPTSAGAACCVSATARTVGCCRTMRWSTPSIRSAAATRGNIGADQLVHVQPLTGALAGAVVQRLEPVRRHRWPRSGAAETDSPQRARSLSRPPASRGDAGRLREARRGGDGRVARGGPLRVDRQLAHRADRHRSRSARPRSTTRCATRRRARISNRCA